MNEDSTLNKFGAQLERIETYLFTLKGVFSFREACTYTGFSPSYLYKLTSLGRIPFSKPEGKKLYFSKDELDTWLLRNHSKVNSQLEDEANSYVTGKAVKQ